MPASYHPDRSPNAFTMPVGADSGPKPLTHQTSRKLKTAANHRTEASPPPKRQKLSARFDPEGDSRILGQDGRPIRLMVGYSIPLATTSYPPVRVFASKQEDNHGGWRVSLFVKSEDVEVGGLARTKIAFKDVQLLPEYYIANEQLAKQGIISALSHTDMPKNMIELKADVSEQVKISMATEAHFEGEEGSEQDSEEIYENYGEDETPDLNAMTTKETEAAQNVTDNHGGFFDNEHLFNLNSEGFLLELSVSSKKFMNDLEKHYEDKARAVEEKHREEIAKMEDGHIKRFAAMRKEMKDLRYKLDHANESIQKSRDETKATKANQPQTQENTTHLQGLRTLVGSQDLVDLYSDALQHQDGSPYGQNEASGKTQQAEGAQNADATTVTVQGVQHVMILTGPNAGFYIAKPVTHEWEGKNWLCYRVLSRPKKVYRMDNVLEERKVVVGEHAYREVITEDGTCKRMAIQEKVVTDVNGGKWAVSIFCKKLRDIIEED